MCTIIAAVQVWPGRPLVIAANRDEALDRPASDPQVDESASPRVLAPRDLRAGGTWLGVNDAGLFVGITNRSAAEVGAEPPVGRPQSGPDAKRPGFGSNRRAIPDPRRRSRGELVFEALAAVDQRGARARIAKLSASDYNPFHLLFADRSGAAVIWSDGQRFHELELAPGVHYITERSFDAAPSGRHAILDRWAEQLAAGPAPDIEGWRMILSDHGPHKPRPLGIRLDGVCVHARPINYGTRSSTVVEFLDERGLRFFHATGRPCETPLVEQREVVAQLLATAGDSGKLCVSSTPG
jgi:uncharacterized protein with NRDE domain